MKELVLKALAVLAQHADKMYALVTSDGGVFINNNGAAFMHAKRSGGREALQCLQVDREGNYRHVKSGQLETEETKANALLDAGNAVPKIEWEGKVEVPEEEGGSSGSTEPPKKKTAAELIDQINSMDTDTMEKLDAAREGDNRPSVAKAYEERKSAIEKEAADKAAGDKAAEEKANTIKQIAALESADHVRELVVDVTDQEILDAANARIAELEKV